MKAYFRPVARAKAERELELEIEHLLFGCQQLLRPLAQMSSMMPRMPRRVSDMKSNGASIERTGQWGGGKAERRHARRRGHVSRRRLCRCLDRLAKGLRARPPSAAQQSRPCWEVVVAEQRHPQRRQDGQALQLAESARHVGPDGPVRGSSRKRRSPRPS